MKEFEALKTAQQILQKNCLDCIDKIIFYLSKNDLVNANACYQNLNALSKDFKALIQKIQKPNTFINDNRKKVSFFNDNVKNNYTNLVDNLLTLSSNRTDINIHRLRKGCGKRDLIWDRPAYEVNAFYYPEENKFVLPAAIIRPPFYDPTRSLSWNYGGIGATIGHEISHGFDSDGRRYDEHGNLRDWWNSTDAHEYKVRAEKLAKLYDSAKYRGMEVHGFLTLVENIADLVGLRFALEGLKLTLGRPLTSLETRDFFTSYTVSWRSKDRLKKAEQLLETNVHAPPMLRVDLIVAQFQEWYEAFEIGEGHPNYIAPEKRISFFG
jgi:putative endopeptidase